MARVTSAVLNYSTTNATDISFVIPCAATQVVDIDMKDLFSLGVTVSGTYAATASTTGLTIKLYYGIGSGPDPNISVGSIPCILGGTTLPAPPITGTAAWACISSNFDAVTSATYTASQATEQTQNTYFPWNNQKPCRYLRVSITNNDPTNAVTIQMFGVSGV